MECPKCGSENTDPIEKLVELDDAQKEINKKEKRYGCWCCMCEFKTV